MTRQGQGFDKARGLLLLRIGAVNEAAVGGPIKLFFLFFQATISRLSVSRRDLLSSRAGAMTRLRKFSLWFRTKATFPAHVVRNNVHGCSLPKTDSKRRTLRKQLLSQPFAPGFRSHSSASSHHHRRWLFEENSFFDQKNKKIGQRKMNSRKHVHLSAHCGPAPAKILVKQTLLEGGWLALSNWQDSSIRQAPLPKDVRTQQPPLVISRATSFFFPFSLPSPLTSSPGPVSIKPPRGAAYSHRLLGPHTSHTIDV